MNSPALASFAGFVRAVVVVSVGVAVISGIDPVSEFLDDFVKGN